MVKAPKRLREIIANNIRECRKKHYPGLGGQKRCAQAFGVTQQYWSPWERGRRTPNEMRMHQLARFFGVTVEYLRADNTRPYKPAAARSKNTPAPATGSAQGSGSIFGCPFYTPPRTGDRGGCWLAESLFGELRENGIPIRLRPADIEQIIESIVKKQSG